MNTLNTLKLNALIANANTVLVQHTGEKKEIHFVAELVQFGSGGVEVSRKLVALFDNVPAYSLNLLSFLSMSGKEPVLTTDALGVMESAVLGDINQTVDNYNRDHNHPVAAFRTRLENLKAL